MDRYSQSIASSSWRTPCLKAAVSILLMLAVRSVRGTTHTFDSVPISGQHTVFLAFQCDDKVDSQFVNIALEKGIAIDFAPYRNAVTDINGDFPGDPYYDEWLIGWAHEQGMGLSVHDQPAAPHLLETFGRDTVRTRWQMQLDFVRHWGNLGPEEIPGFVWVGHQTNTELRAMARQFGFPWTRGALSHNEDLYLNGLGWGNPPGAESFMPPIMYHRSLVPSCSMYRLNTLGSGFPKTSSAADTTGWWAGTHAFLDQLSRVNGVAFLNLHPGWTGPCRETCSRDSLYSRSLQLPNGNLIHCRGRQGNTGRNDISAMQLDCILEAMAHWDSLKLASDGVRRLAIVPIEQLMTSSVLPWREDDTSDPDIAVANAWSTLDSLVDSGRSFSGDVALRPRDQVLVHVDGTGSIMAGTGTMDSPLPSTSFNHLFNCSVEFVGHSPGDTLTLEPDPAMRCGNVRFNLNGLTLLAGSSELPLMEYMSSASQGRFLHHIEWVNGTFDFAGNHTTVGVSLGDVATIANPVLRPSDLHFRGITFRAGEDALWLRNVHHPVVDSCFFQALPGVSGGSLIRGGSGLYWPRIRNCVFDLRGAGNQSTALDFGNNSTDNWQDSLAIVNNIYITGTGSHTVIRMPAHANLDSSGVGRKLRLGGSYVISNRSSEPDDLVSGQRLTTLSDLQASVQRNQPGFAWPAAWEPGAWNGFDSVENVSDTLRFGGWTGSGSCQHGLTASIGPVLYTGSVPYVRIHLGAGSTIELEWESVPGAIGYHVYHKDSGNDWHIEATCATTHASMSPTNPLPLGNRFEQYRVRTVFQGPETPSHGLDDRVSPEAD